MNRTDSMTRHARMQHMIDVAERVLPEGVEYGIAWGYDSGRHQVIEILDESALPALQAHGAVVDGDWYGSQITQRNWVANIDGVRFRLIESYREEAHGALQVPA